MIAIVFGGGAYFAYRMFVQPAELDLAAEIAEANAPEPTPPPDYSIPRFEEMMKVVAESDVPKSQEALRNFIAQYPKSTKLAEAKAELGRINMGLVYGAGESPRKTAYEVVSGDSLLRIAGKTDSNAEQIMRSNNLLSIDLRIGQELLIPSVSASIFVDRAAKTLTLLDEGNLLKEYPIVSLKIQGSADSPIDTTVADRLAMKDSDRVAFGSGGYAGAERWLMLGSNGIVIRGVPPAPEGEGTEENEEAADATESPEDEGAENVEEMPNMPPGIVLDAADMSEIFPLVRQGATVTIQ
ncbi:MAG: LysM peptidoglycan-binding domain-containing protein [Chthoniobacterales bacterium]